MISISCDGICLEFGTEIVLDKITFSLNEGDKLGIVGVNGAGKSSLFKIITGEYIPSDGNVYISKDKTVDILEQNTGLDSNKCILDEMLLSFEHLLDAEKQIESLNKEIEKYDGKSHDENFHHIINNFTEISDKFNNDGGYEFRSRCKGILKQLGFDETFWDLKVESLSGGQKTRLSLAKLLLKEPDILLLDEPTNHLDMDALYWLEDFLGNYKSTVIVISHDRYFLDKVTNKILEIENTHGKIYNGNYTQYVAQRENDRVVHEKQYQNQQREISRIEAFIEQQRRWNREHNIIAAESRQKMLDRMVKIEKPTSSPSKIRLTFQKSGESGQDVIGVKNLSKSYPGKPLFKDVSFLVKKNEHVFISGKNGCGKSTLIKILAGKLQQDFGTFEYGYNVAVGYYDQENQELNDENTVIEELWTAYDKLTQVEIRNSLALFLFKGDDIEKKVSVLSGGEKARLTLTKLILSKINFLILDEPTNHLDINSREALEKALLDFDGTIIAVSHDRYFINKLSTRILDFIDTGVYDYKGNYEDYVEYKNKYLNNKIQSDDEKNNISSTKEKYLQNKKELADQRKQERKIQRTQDEIEKTEKEIEDVDNEMHGDSAADYLRVNVLFEQKQTLENKLLELYELWEVLNQ